MILISGILVADIIVHGLKKIADPGEIIYCESDLHIGGHAANVSINLIKLGLSKDEIIVIGPIGNDIFGEFIENTLNLYLKNVNLQKISARTSKDIIIILENQDRRYHTEPGANLFLDVNFIKKFIRTEDPFIFYIGGAGLLGKFDDELEGICEEAKKYNWLTFLDIVAPYQRDWSFIIPALQFIDIFHCNDYELRHISKLANLQNSIIKIAEKGVKLPIITLGDKGVVAFLNNRIISQTPFKTQIIDPTGAGDAFCANFIYELSKDEIKNVVSAIIENLSYAQLKNILMSSQAASAACISAVGTTNGVSRHKVDEIINKEGKIIIKKTKEKKI
ncbi:MAG: carbohydrate kinase family protein [Candidatus Helarchaeota archaeon]|nr:carbohydrate kinase family protein [Candidatus Helarchaeota archaeon]